jgi:hypothetical protein
MACLTDDTAFGFAEGLLSVEEAARIEAHLDACADCRAFVAGVARMLGVTAGPAGEAEEAGAPDGAAPVDEGEEAGEESAEATTATPLARGSTVGRYLVLSPLGAGGMGLVYAAYDPELDRKVALKIVRPDAAGGRRAAELRTRLVREAQAAARLSHPNVITIYDVGTVDDEVFLAMELVDGPTLAQWTRARSARAASRPTRSWRWRRSRRARARFPPPWRPAGRPPPPPKPGGTRRKPPGPGACSSASPASPAGG